MCTAIGRFIQDRGFTFPIFIDKNGEVAEQYRIQAYQTSYMIDSEGRIQYIALGAMNYDLMVIESKKLD